MDRSLNQHFWKAPPYATALRSAASTTRFASYAWSLLGLNFFFILWGAFVRASGSGAGCGNHWPDCGGTFLPEIWNFSKAVEFMHRAQAGMDSVCIIGLVAWAFLAFAKKHPARLGAILCLLFLIGEAAIGAALVHYGWVKDDNSIHRVIAMSAHLVNTFFLLMALSLTAWWGGGGARLQLRGQGAIGWAVGAALLATILVGISGAVAALSDTLFPSSNIASALQQDFSSSAHFLVRLRIAHPLLAISAALGLVLVSGLLTALRPSPHVQKWSQWTQSLVLFEIGLGVLNVFLLAPIWMQLTHLLVAQGLWVCLVLLGASALAQDVPHVELSSIGAAAESGIAEAPTWRDYLVLTKPRVISLLLFTTWMGMVIAAQGWPGLWLFIATGLGLYAAAGSSNAINMVLERDLDLAMERTATRPTVTQKIAPRDALKFAFALEAGSFVLLWSAANLLAALLALAGLVVYVVVYTLLLKRRTWTNIVIGGAAGAFPPLIGYAAVAGKLSLLAWCLFAIIFLWTPVHFWALAILIKDDYAKAGVPMLPCVKGERNTVLQIAAYAVLTAAISAAPLLLGVRGPLYIGAAIGLNAMLLWQSWKLIQQTTRPRASKLFHFSMIYLALLFLAMALDRSFWTTPRTTPTETKAQVARLENRPESGRTF